MPLITMRRVLLLTPLVIFGFAGVVLFTVFLRSAAPGAFEDNLLPELIGFCLEGFFLVGLFTLIQGRMERDRRMELRQSLRGALRDVLSHLDVAMRGEHAEPSSSQTLENDPRVVSDLFARLNKTEMQLKEMAQLKKAAARSHSILRDLIPVAAQLSPDHMRWWLSIAESVLLVAESTDRPSLNFAVHRFLINLGEFDQLHL